MEAKINELLAGIQIVKHVDKDKKNKKDPTFENLFDL